MKLNWLIKATPLFSTLLLIILLSLNNQKEYTKLRILIWNTPSLSLATYLSISTGTGFIFSYFITTYLGKINQTNIKQSLRFKDEYKNEVSNEYNESTMNQTYDNTLIERDIKDPSPTINASFRIIGRTEKINKNFVNNNQIEFDSYDVSEQQDDEITNYNENINKTKSIGNDWNDESYSEW